MTHSNIVRGTEYPFHKETYGRFDKFGSWVENKWHVCCEPGSVFLSPESVSISGGPFTSISMDQIEPTYTLKLVRFWNWGDLWPGAGHGVDYYIERPVFRLKNSV